MNARLPVPLRHACPVPGTGETLYRLMLAGIPLECLMAGDEEDGIEVRAIWHHGQDISELLAQQCDERIIECWIEHSRAEHEEIRIERFAKLGAT
ncbi:MAG: hypothetical protein LBJ15_18355 [Comamonas sp.]|jgi:hypothetical protein|uniref:hypothetical protein n=1 Tax=Comamonas sp. TaxID=34028 RepID=UPI00281B9F12|nr:hypothetical protein [Comamonas sp.]MDR0215940.1 hypothetical protein [Comamonas sp.]